MNRTSASSMIWSSSVRARKKAAGSIGARSGLMSSSKPSRLPFWSRAERRAGCRSFSFAPAGNDTSRPRSSDRSDRRIGRRVRHPAPCDGGAAGDLCRPRAPRRRRRCAAGGRLGTGPKSPRKKGRLESLVSAHRCECGTGSFSTRFSKERGKADTT